ncbi:MAG: hypothetical protein JWM74_4341, partial [Myxococcaceae bacterium]|nr:hypothetical protein [Myxococcaceae bacterium]
HLITSMNLAGCFLSSSNITADASAVYLASGCTPTLFIVSRASGHAVETVTLPSNADSVGVDATSIYVGLPDATVLTITKASPHTTTSHAVGARWSGIFPRDGKLYASTFQARGAVTSARVFLAALNDGDVMREVDRATFATTREYATALREQTVAFDRTTGTFAGSVPNPFNSLGQMTGVHLRADESFLYQTMPGCCGINVVIRDQLSLAQTGIIFRNFVDDVMRRGRFLFGGTEAGEVIAWDMQQPASPPVVSEVNLRTLTGHNGIEDIEIRGIWSDEHDDLVFAASSWGNDLSRGPDLPSFFILGF